MLAMAGILLFQCIWVATDHSFGGVGNLAQSDHFWAGTIQLVLFLIRHILCNQPKWLLLFLFRLRIPSNCDLLQNAIRRATGIGIRADFDLAISRSTSLLSGFGIIIMTGECLLNSTDVILIL